MAKKWAIFVLLLVLIKASTGTSYGAHSSPVESSEFKLMKTGDYDIFTNYIDGYSFHIDKDMEVDMTYGKIRTVLENRDKRIEIFKEYTAGNHLSYINYSKGFLKNREDHILLKEGWEKIGPHNVYVTSWTREKLARVENDLNHYTTIDIPSADYCYTIIIKTSMENDEDSVTEYRDIIDSFNVFYGEKEGVNIKMKGLEPEERNWNLETLSFYNKYFNREKELSWGLYEPNTNYDMGTGLYDFNKLSHYEDVFSYNFPVLVNYTEFENKSHHPDLNRRLDQAWEKGKVLELTLQTKQMSGSNQVYSILKGEYDDFLYDYAKAIKDFEHPVLFRLGNEMNGDWCPYSGYNTSRDPEIFKAFYKYVYQVFEETGVDNVIWIFNPNSDSYPNFKWNHSYLYYPGDEYVDLVGMTAYNTGTYYSGVGEKWKTFESLYFDLYNEYVDSFDQPLMITEFASASAGGDKGLWIRDMLNKIEAYHRIKMAIWWDGKDYDGSKVARNYTMDERPEVLRTFIDYFRAPWYFTAFG